MVIFLMSEKSYNGIMIQIQITKKSRLFFKTFLFILFFLERGGGKYSESYGWPWVGVCKTTYFRWIS
jgi:hypothetical protein